MSELGKGSYGQVFKVKNIENKKQYAVKAFSKEKAYSEELGKQSLINEIEVMRSLNHKNLMAIEGVYESNNSLYICVELLAEQLLDRIQCCHTFSKAETKRIMQSCLRGLAELHKQGYMHRDIKP